MNSMTVVRGWAALDLAVTAPMAVPVLAPWFVATLYQMNALLGQHAAMPAFASLHWLFLGLAGALGVLWALVRLLQPSRFLGLMDAVARLWVGGLIAWFLTRQAVPAVLWLFVATEWLGALSQLASLRRR